MLPDFAFSLFFGHTVPMASDDDFDAMMTQIGVDPLAKKVKRKRAVPRAPMRTGGAASAPPATASRAAASRQPSPRAVVAELHEALRTAQVRRVELDARVAAQDTELRAAGAEIGRMNAQIAALTAERDAAKAAAAVSDDRVAELRKAADDLDRERRTLQRKLGTAKPAPISATPAVAVFDARGLRPGHEQHQALRALSEQRPADVLAALELADPTPLTTLLDQRVVLASSTAELPADSGHVMVRVSEDRCEFGGASDVVAAWRRFIAACAAANVRTVTIVGGSPSYRRQLKALLKDWPQSPKLVLVSGTKRRPKNKAASDLRTSDIVLIWGATELDHSVSAPYTEARDPKVTIIAHRGISGMLERATALVESRPR